MSGNFCICLLKFLSHPGSTVSTILELGFIIIIITIGIAINMRFRTKLQDENKQMPIGRRGNVVAPVMSVFCLLQIIFWPFDLILLWEVTNEVVPVDSIHPWLCKGLVITLKSGRMCIAYHSLFVALIRYMHIVQDRALNQWNYERLANCFKFFCILFPLGMEALGTLTHGFDYFALVKEIRDCMGFSVEFDDGTTMEEPNLNELVKWTMIYLPASLVKALSYTYFISTIVVSSNIIEAYLYLRIFQKMKRYCNLEKEFV